MAFTCRHGKEAGGGSERVGGKCNSLLLQYTAICSDRSWAIDRKSMTGKKGKARQEKGRHGDASEGKAGVPIKGTGIKQNRTK